jgi:hypothetical protein
LKPPVRFEPSADKVEDRPLLRVHNVLRAQCCHAETAYAFLTYLRAHLLQLQAVCERALALCARRDK